MSCDTKKLFGRYDCQPPINVTIRLYIINNKTIKTMNTSIYGDKEVTHSRNEKESRKTRFQIAIYITSDSTVAPANSFFRYLPSDCGVAAFAIRGGSIEGWRDIVGEREGIQG